MLSILKMDYVVNLSIADAPTKSVMLPLYELHITLVIEPGVAPLFLVPQAFRNLRRPSSHSCVQVYRVIIKVNLGSIRRFFIFVSRSCPQKNCINNQFTIIVYVDNSDDPTVCRIQWHDVNHDVTWLMPTAYTCCLRRTTSLCFSTFSRRSHVHVHIYTIVHVYLQQQTAWCPSVICCEARQIQTTSVRNGNCENVVARWRTYCMLHAISHINLSSI